MLKLPTWIVVLIGLIFNISSALITHFMIETKINHLSSISMKMGTNAKEMDLLWSQIEGVERKREVLYLLLNQVPDLIFVHMRVTLR